jgi:hypothetical protein
VWGVTKRAGPWGTTSPGRACSLILISSRIGVHIASAREQVTVCRVSSPALCPIHRPFGWDSDQGGVSLADLSRAVPSEPVRRSAGRRGRRRTPHLIKKQSDKTAQIVQPGASIPQRPNELPASVVRPRSVSPKASLDGQLQKVATCPPQSPNKRPPFRGAKRVLKLSARRSSSGATQWAARHGTCVSAATRTLSGVHRDQPSWRASP